MPSAEKKPLLKRPGLYPCLKRRWPCLHRIVTSKPREFWFLKALLGLVYGFILGVALHYGIITSMILPAMVRTILGLTFTVALAIGCAASVQVRCISSLILPTITGKNGRSYLWALLIAALLAGPFANIVSNAGEVTRSVSCSARLAQNHSMGKMELMFKPVTDIMLELQEQAGSIHLITAKVREMFKPVTFQVADQSEIEDIKKGMSKIDKEQGMDRSEHIDKRHNVNEKKSPEKEAEDKFERKLDYRCEEVYSMGVVHCKEVFAHNYQKCLDKIKVVGKLMCWPLKITAICNLVKIIPKLAGINCNSMEAVNEGFGEGYETARKSADDLDKSFEVNMQYKVVEGEQALHRKTAQDVTLAVAQEFNSRRSWFDRILSFMNKFMAFLFLRVVYSAFGYHKKYVTDFYFDNIYINNYFRWTDSKRQYDGRRCLIPLKSLEKQDTMKAGRLAMTAPEKSKLVRGTVNLLVRAFTLFMVVFVDRLIYEIMDLVRRHSQVDYKQSGSHHIGIVIHGRGAMGQMLRAMLKGFNKKHSINTISSNVACLPHPTLTPNEDIYRLGGLVLLIFVFMVIESYGLRLRHVVAGFFYPRREKRRTLFLYNDMLKKRKGYLKHARQLVRSRAKEQKLSDTLGIIAAIRYKFPTLCSCLKACGKKKCLICQEPEDKNFIHCRCKFVYCANCWQDILEHCYACRHTDDIGSDTDDDIARNIRQAQNSDHDSFSQRSMESFHPDSWDRFSKDSKGSFDRNYNGYSDQQYSNHSVYSDKQDSNHIYDRGSNNKRDFSRYSMDSFNRNARGSFDNHSDYSFEHQSNRNFDLRSMESSVN